MASQLLPVISRGHVYQQVEWVLLDAHSLLLQHQLTVQPHIVDSIAVSCERLSALIRLVTLPVNDHLLQLQLKVSLDGHTVDGVLITVVVMHDIHIYRVLLKG